MNSVFKLMFLLSLLLLTISFDGVSAGEFEVGVNDVLGVSVAIFVVIVVAALVVVVGIPIAICFCCGVCCFRRRRAPPPQIVQVYGDGKPAGYGLQGNVNIAMTNPKPQQQPTYVAQPPPSFHGNASASAYSPSPQATYGNVPLQSAAPMSQRQQSPPPSSEYLPAPSSGIDNPMYNADPHYIPNRFARPQSMRPAGNDPTWNAITREMKDWQKDHNIYYGNTYKPGAYGAPPLPPPEERPSAPPEQHNNPYTANDNFTMY